MAQPFAQAVAARPSVGLTAVSPTDLEVTVGGGIAPAAGGTGGYLVFLRDEAGVGRTIPWPSDPTGGVGGGDWPDGSAVYLSAGHGAPAPIHIGVSTGHTYFAANYGRYGYDEDHDRVMAFSKESVVTISAPRSTSLDAAPTELVATLVDGQCGCWAKLLLECISQQRAETAKTAYIFARPKSRFKGIAVKNFSGISSDLLCLKARSQT